MSRRTQSKARVKDWIELFKDIPISDRDIMDLLENETKVVLVQDLNKYRNIDELLHPYGNVVLLYNTPHQPIGHWVALLKTVDEDTGKEVLEYFDSYGKKPDQELRRYDGLEPHLTHLLLNYGGKMSYNEYPFQKLSNKVKSCGRWVALRILFGDLPLDKFSSLFFNKHSDDLATYLTMNANQL